MFTWLNVTDPPRSRLYLLCATSQQSRPAPPCSIPNPKDRAPNAPLESAMARAWGHVDINNQVPLLEAGGGGGGVGVWLPFSTNSPSLTLKQYPVCVGRSLLTSCSHGEEAAYESPSLSAWHTKAEMKGSSAQLWVSCVQAAVPHHRSGVKSCDQ